MTDRNIKTPIGIGNVRSLLCRDQRVSFPKRSEGIGDEDKKEGLRTVGEAGTRNMGRSQERYGPEELGVTRTQYLL